MILMWKSVLIAEELFLRAQLSMKDTIILISFVLYTVKLSFPSRSKLLYVSSIQLIH